MGQIVLAVLGWPVAYDAVPAWRPFTWVPPGWGRLAAVTAASALGGLVMRWVAGRAYRFAAQRDRTAEE